MPRAGWSAVGGIVAALVAMEGGGGIAPFVAAVVAGAAGCLGIVLRRAPLVAVGIGALVVLARVLVGTATTPAAVDVLPPGDGPWHAQVASVGSVSAGQQRAVLVLERSEQEERTPDAGSVARPVRVYAQLPRYPVVVPGERIAFTARLEPAPTGTGFGEYLARNRINATTRIAAFEHAGSPDGIGGGLETLRRSAGGVLLTTIPAPEGGLAAGILIGLRDLVDRDVADAFTTSGLSHVVAISGWNIALVGALMVALLRRLPRRPRALVVILAIVAYTLAAGASPSVVRAAVMGAIVLLARESGRAGEASTALGLAAWVMLLIDPALVSDAGYRLSVAATAGLLAWASPITAALRQHVPRRTPGWLTETLGVSLAAQAATLPLVLADFGRLSLISPLANLLVAPLVAPAMAAGVVGLAGGVAVSLGAPSVLGLLGGTAGWAALAPIVAIARWSAAVPFASVELPAPVDVACAVVAAVVLLALGTAGGRRVIAGGWRRVRSSPEGTRPRSQRPDAAPKPAIAATASACARNSQSSRDCVRCTPSRAHTHSSRASRPRRSRRGPRPHRPRCRIATGRALPCHGAGHRSGRRDPPRGATRRADARRHRARSRPAAQPARCPVPTVGSAARRRRRDAPT